MSNGGIIAIAILIGIGILIVGIIAGLQQKEQEEKQELAQRQ